jgi:hypothetical protein
MKEKLCPYIFTSIKITVTLKGYRNPLSCINEVRILVSAAKRTLSQFAWFPSNPAFKVQDSSLRIYKFMNHVHFVACSFRHFCRRPRGLNQNHSLPSNEEMKYKRILAAISLLATVPHCWHFHVFVTWIPHTRLPKLLLRSYFPRRRWTLSLTGINWPATLGVGKIGRGC